MTQRELDHFRIEANYEIYSIPICEIEENGDIQLQINRKEWNHPTLVVELPGNREIRLSDNNSAPIGELYARWGENGRLYISGKGFKARDIIHRKIGQRIIVNTFKQ